LEKPLVSQIDPWFEFVWRVFLVEMTQWWLFFKAFFVTVMIWKVLCNVQNFKNLALNRWVVCSYMMLACWYDAEFGIESKGFCAYTLLARWYNTYEWINSEEEIWVVEQAWVGAEGRLRGLFVDFSGTLLLFWSQEVLG